MEALKEAVDVWWPRLEKAVKEIQIPKVKSSADADVAEPAKPAVDVNEMLEEVLRRVRMLDDRVRRMDTATSTSGKANSRSRDRSHESALEYLRQRLEQEGLPAIHSTVGSSSIDVVVGDAPDDIPMRVMDAAQEVATVERVPVHLIMPRRTLLFDPDGEQRTL